MNYVAVSIGVAGIVGGLFALYVRLTLSDFIVKVLDDRYPTRREISLGLENIENSIAALPCRGGKICHFVDGGAS